jgi:hypothetical protein
MTQEPLTPQTSPDKIPGMLLTPNEWAAENIRLQAEYIGMPESSLFAANARRFLALDAHIKKLEAELSDVRRWERDAAGYYD